MPLPLATIRDPLDPLADPDLSPAAPETVLHPVMLQRWEHLSFVHWPCRPHHVQRHLPPGIEVDTFDDQAWVGLVPFHLSVRVPVLPPIPPGHRPYCEDPPDQQEILRAMPRVTRGIPYIYEEFRDDIEFTVEKLVDKVDPPRFIPLIGPAQLHHCHWKCTVYFTETVDSSYPFPFRVKRRRAEVVYIDKDHLHLCVSGQDAQREVFNRMTEVRP